MHSTFESTSSISINLGEEENPGEEENSEGVESPEEEIAEEKEMTEEFSGEIEMNEEAGENAKVEEKGERMESEDEEVEKPFVPIYGKMYLRRRVRKPTWRDREEELASRPQMLTRQMTMSFKRRKPHVEEKKAEGNKAQSSSEESEWKMEEELRKQKELLAKMEEIGKKIEEVKGQKKVKETPGEMMEEEREMMDEEMMEELSEASGATGESEMPELAKEKELMVGVGASPGFLKRLEREESAKFESPRIMPKLKRVDGAEESELTGTSNEKKGRKRKGGRSRSKTTAYNWKPEDEAGPSKAKAGPSKVKSGSLKTPLPFKTDEAVVDFVNEILISAGASGKKGKRKRGRPMKRVVESKEEVKAGPSKVKPGSSKHPLEEDEEPVTFENTDDEEAGTQCTTTELRSDGTTADWDTLLNSSFYNLRAIPPVSYFKHAPLSHRFDEFFKTGRMFELFNPYLVFANASEYNPTGEMEPHWIATLDRFAGYKALVKWETFGHGIDRYVWISFFTDLPKHWGFSNEMWKKEKSCILVPPPFVKEAVPNWVDALVEKVHALDDKDLFDSIPRNWATLVRNAIKEGQYIGDHGTKIKCVLGMFLEAMDMKLLTNYRRAKVTAFTGNRVLVRYVSIKDGSLSREGFWFSMGSENLHQLGWGRAIGLDVMGMEGYENCIFPMDNIPPHDQKLFKNIVVGMCFEARHPCFTAFFSPAVIRRKFRYGYFIADVDESQFMFHITDPCIRHCFWSERNEIDFLVSKPLKGIWRGGMKNGVFNWNAYLNKHPNCSFAPIQHFQRREHQFLPGMKMEAVEIATPEYLGPVTVKRIVENLLYLHFDGWEVIPRHCQWTDAESKDIFPIGFAEAICLDFQGTPAPVEEQLLEQWPDPDYLLDVKNH